MGDAQGDEETVVDADEFEETLEFWIVLLGGREILRGDDFVGFFGNLVDRVKEVAGDFAV